MKKIISGVTVLVLAILFFSCNKEDHNSKKLCRGEGRWTVDFATNEIYDSTGKVIWDTTVNNVGELVLFRTGSLEALYGYRQAVFLVTDTAGTHAYPLEYVFDGKRITLKYCIAPYDINGTYSSAIDKKNEQQWEIYGSNGNTSAVTSLTGKFIMHLTRSK